MNNRFGFGTQPAQDLSPDTPGDIGLDSYEIWRRRVLSPRLAELRSQTRWAEERGRAVRTPAKRKG
jgi:hypothetical protein